MPLALQIGEWHLGFNDNDPLGWAITLAYFVAAAACWRAATAEGRRTPRGTFWLATCALLVLLGINKQLDLQLLAVTLVKQFVGHTTAGGKAAVRHAAALALLACFAVAFGAIAWRVRGHWRGIRAAAATIGLLFLFIFIRSETLRTLLRPVNADLVALHVTLELTPLVLMTVLAMRRRAELRRPGHARREPEPFRQHAVRTGNRIPASVIAPVVVIVILAVPLWYLGCSLGGETRGLITRYTGLAAYLACAITCTLAWRAARQQRAPGATFWLGLTMLQWIIFAEVLLRLRHTLAETLRGVAKSEHWYGQRSTPQLLVSASVIGTAMLAAGWFAFTRRTSAERAATIGAAGSLVSLLLPVVSFHDADQFLYAPAGPVSVTGVIWLVCAGLTTLGAAATIRAHRRSSGAAARVSWQ